MASGSSPIAVEAPASAAPPAGNPTYFETQRLMRCGAHAMNNLLGRPAFSTETLDELAKTIGGTLSLQHRWPVLGNYDANVVQMALLTCGYEAAFWDARRPDDELVLALNAPNVRGALVNVRSRLGWLPLGRHWTALRPSHDGGGAWLDLDSNLRGPVVLEGAAALLERLRCALREEEGHVLVVREADGGG